MKSTRRRIRRVRRSAEELQIAAERQSIIESVKRRRGIRVDFTGRKLNSRNEETGKLRKIVKCGECGQKGIRSDALFPSVLVIHRGTLKEGKFSMTEFHVCSGG